MSGLETVTKNSGEVLVGALFALEMILNSDTASSKVTSVFKWIHTNSETQAKKLYNFTCRLLGKEETRSAFLALIFTLITAYVAVKRHVPVEQLFLHRV